MDAGTDSNRHKAACDKNEKYAFCPACKAHEAKCFQCIQAGPWIGQPQASRQQASVMCMQWYMKS